MTDHPQSSGLSVVLGVGGGIAAYKVCEVLRRLTEAGHDVTVVPTASALRFVGEATWAALSGHPVRTEVFTDADVVPHVTIGRRADLVVVAPATADLLARAAAGMADDLLTATLLTARCPVLMVPAMHTEMWLHQATRDNVVTLRYRGVHVMEPGVGRLTGADSGPGRLPEPDDIVSAALELLDPENDPDIDGDLALPLPGPAATTEGAPTSTTSASPMSRTMPTVPAVVTPDPYGPLAGLKVLVTAGGTREFLDPVRFLGNASSGKQGYALAREAAARGAHVTLVAANTSLPEPPGVEVVPVVTTAELAEAVYARAADASVVVMAAAPADFRPASSTAYKIKKTADGIAAPIELVQNPDILAELGRRRVEASFEHDTEHGTETDSWDAVEGSDETSDETSDGNGVGRRPPAPVLVGFAAETGDAEHGVLELAREKIARKRCDLLVVNDVTDGKVFGSDRNHVVLLAADGRAAEVPAGSKDEVAAAVWDAVRPLLPY